MTTRVTKKEIESSTRTMESTFYYCPTCNVVRLGRDTNEALPGYGHLAIYARACPTDATRMDHLNDDDVDLGIVDYLAGSE